MKKYFDVKLETIVPATITFRVLAETEKEALDQVMKKSVAPTGFKPEIQKRRVLKAVVCLAGSVVIKLTKRFGG